MSIKNGWRDIIYRITDTFQNQIMLNELLKYVIEKHKNYYYCQIYGLENANKQRIDSTVLKIANILTIASYNVQYYGTDMYIYAYIYEVQNVPLVI